LLGKIGNLGRQAGAHCALLRNTEKPQAGFLGTMAIVGADSIRPHTRKTTNQPPRATRHRPGGNMPPLRPQAGFPHAMNGFPQGLAANWGGSGRTLCAPTCQCRANAAEHGMG